MLKQISLSFVLLTSVTLFGRPNHHNSKYHNTQHVIIHHDTRPYHIHHYHNNSSGVRLASDIVGLVGASLFTAGVLAETIKPQPMIIQPVVQQQVPVVVQQPTPKYYIVYPDGRKEPVY